MPAKRTGINRERLENRFSVLSLSLGEAQEKNEPVTKFTTAIFPGWIADEKPIYEDESNLSSCTAKITINICPFPPPIWRAALC